MDYEKKYNEALKWMRELYPGLHGATKEDAEHFFPELRESEDERIRKEMIAYFAHRADVTGFIDEGEDCKRWISYLEKQKEQKPIDYPYLPGWRKNHDNNKPELKRSVLMLTTHGVAEGEWLGEKWCQYRWSCELKDGEVLYWIHLSDLERLEKEGEEKQKEQKSAEWSEEDENMLNRIIETLSLPPIYDTKACAKMVSWLKSLRPSWKPSDNQMSMLRAIVNDPNNVGAESCHLAMQSLYNDLLKLK